MSFLPRPAVWVLLLALKAAGPCSALPTCDASELPSQAEQRCWRLCSRPSSHSLQCPQLSGGKNYIKQSHFACCFPSLPPALSPEDAVAAPAAGIGPELPLRSLLRVERNPPRRVTTAAGACSGTRSVVVGILCRDWDPSVASKTRAKASFVCP